MGGAAIPLLNVNNTGGTDKLSTPPPKKNGFSISMISDQIFTFENRWQRINIFKSSQLLFVPCDSMTYCSLFITVLTELVHFLPISNHALPRRVPYTGPIAGAQEAAPPW